MSSKSYDSRTQATHFQKIRLDMNSRRRRAPPKICLDCKETNESVKIFSDKINRIEDIVNKFHKNFPKKTKKISIFHAKFTLNNIPCELEYDLSHFTLENLQKLANFTIQNCNNNIISNDDNNNFSTKK